MEFWSKTVNVSYVCLHNFGEAIEILLKFCQFRLLSMTQDHTLARKHKTLFIKNSWSNPKDSFC